MENKIDIKKIFETLKEKLEAMESSLDDITNGIELVTDEIELVKGCFKELKEIVKKNVIDEDNEIEAALPSSEEEEKEVVKISTINNDDNKIKVRFGVLRLIGRIY